MILAIDTATSYATLALMNRDGALVRGGRGETPRSHAEELGPLLSTVIAGDRGDLTAVVGGRGPGSFAGLRVGLAAVASIGWALRLPVIGICTLDVVATQAGASFTGFVVSDARRSEVFYAEYHEGQRTGGLAVASRAEVATITQGQRLAGDVHLLGDEDKRSMGSINLSPLALGATAAAVVRRNEAEPLRPLYLRVPDVANQPGLRLAPSKRLGAGR
jgi:tRNA threonylcarbamoyl adenosine modification protein YeaZ